MKQDIIALSKVAVKYRDTTKSQWWGRFPGTTADFEGVQYMLDEFKRLGLQTSSVPYTLPTDWRPTSWDASYETADGKTVNLTTIFPASGTKAIPDGITAEAIWVGVGAEADFLGRDVAGKAVIIYSTFVPGGRSHSASDRAGLFNSNTRAAQKGAALIINVMAVPGNGQFQPEGGVRTVTQMTVSQDEGFALRDRLGAGEKITITAHLTVPALTNIQTAYHYAVLPGVSDEEIMIQMHTDGYFYAAEDNNGGMASGLELARHYAALPKARRPRTMVWLMFPDHHHGEYAHNQLIDPTYHWDKVALKLTLEHPSETQLYMYNDDLTPSNTMSATRWNALGSPEFERMAFATLTDFGNSVYGVEDGPKNGDYAPSFHTINHIIYHTSLDAPELVPAEGQALRHACVRRDHRSGQQDDDSRTEGAGLAVPGRARLDSWPDWQLTSGSNSRVVGAATALLNVLLDGAMAAVAPMILSDGASAQIIAVRTETKDTTAAISAARR